MRYLVDLAFFLAGLAAFKGVIEPAAAYWGKRAVRKLLPKLFDKLDPLLPETLTKGSSSLRGLVMDTILVLETQERIPLSDQQREWLIQDWRNDYDPIKNAKTLEYHKGGIGFRANT